MKIEMELDDGEQEALRHLLDLALKQAGLEALQVALHFMQKLEATKAAATAPSARLAAPAAALQPADSPGGSSGQVQYNLSGAFAGLSTLTVLGSSPGLPLVGDGGPTIATNKLVVNNSAAGSNSRQFVIGNGNWYSTTIPFIQPYTDNTGLAFDIMPKGATVSSQATCWMDVCSTDVTNDSTDYETLNLKKGPTYSAVGSSANGTGTVRQLLLQHNGGFCGIGLGTGYGGLLKNQLEVVGSLALGAYAGQGITGPSNGAIISGSVGVGTSTPQFPCDVNGTISSGYASGGGEFRTIQTAGGGYYVSLKTDTAHGKSGLYRSGDDFFIYYDTSAGDTVLQTVFGGANIRFLYQSTEHARMNSSGNWGFGTGYSSSAPTVQVDVNGAIRTRPTTVASLPSASTAGTGARHCVTDATQTLTAGIGATVTGGGSNTVPVFSTGSNWLIG